MSLNKFSNLEEEITTRDFLIEFKELDITHVDSLYTYKKSFIESMKEFKFSIRMMFIFSFLGFFIFILPGAILFYFAFKLNKRAKESAKALDTAIEEYTFTLKNNHRK